MKKNLILLTGIVFLITILVAGSCSNGTKQNSSPEEEKGSTNVADDSTTVIVYLKERSIGGSMHLLMSDSRKPDCEVIDNLETEVYRGYTIIFKKAKHSEVDEVISISLEEEAFITFTEDVKVDSGLYVLVVGSE
ncbi:MAG: hypothetical protein DRQ62_14855, partial [Gammaproteobacteria bacterium]